MNFWTKLWKIVDGNKTMIGAVLLMIIQITAVQSWLGEAYEIVKYIIIVITGASAVHHVAKGSFNTDYK